jgi:hypothetical protein
MKREGERGVETPGAAKETAQLIIIRDAHHVHRNRPLPLNGRSKRFCR